MRGAFLTILLKPRCMKKPPPELNRVGVSSALGHAFQHGPRRSGTGLASIAYHIRAGLSSPAGHFRNIGRVNAEVRKDEPKGSVDAADIMGRTAAGNFSSLF